MVKKTSLTFSFEALCILSILNKHSYEGYIVGGAVRDLLLDKKKISDYDFTTNAKPEEIQAIFPEHFYENTFGTVGVAREHLLEQMGFAQNLDNAQQSAPDASVDAQTHSNAVIDLERATKIHVSLQPTHSNSHNSVNNAAAIHSQEVKEIYEITTFRSDGIYTDHRRPTEVSWGETLADDLSRRDFTINALAIAINPAALEHIDFSVYVPEITLSESDYTIIDLHEGITDLEKNLITTVNDPNTRFQEDALRMLRAIRLSVQLNMQIEANTFDAITANSHLLQHISFERIRDEFLKMIASDFPKEAIELLDETGLLHYIIPELLEGKGVEQAGHHTTDVWTHNLDALAACPSPDPIVRLATLLHDIAKPHTYQIISGLPTFYNHEIVGSRIAKKIALRLRLSKLEVERIFVLVRHHMFYYQTDNTDASIRRFMKKVGLENINDILDLREADRLGSGARKTSWRLEEMKERMVAQLHQPFSVTDLAINGHDLMEKLQLKPGPQLGKILQELFEKVLENPELNEKETLLAEAQKLLES